MCVCVVIPFFLCFFYLIFFLVSCTINMIVHVLSPPAGRPPELSERYNYTWRGYYGYFIKKGATEKIAAGRGRALQGVGLESMLL